MSNTQAMCTSFKSEILTGTHNFGVAPTRGSTAADSFKAALYLASATVNATTTAYSASNEVSGTGYTAGGVVLTGVTISSDGYTAYVNFNNASFSASVTARCALIYNASKANRSIAVLDFGSDKTSSSFIITMPANTATSALIRSSN
jgi:hypothetical protein